MPQETSGIFLCMLERKLPLRVEKCPPKWALSAPLSGQHVPP